jgi:hypothetical protein
MEPDTILTFSAPAREPGRVDATPPPSSSCCTPASTGEARRAAGPGSTHARRGCGGSRSRRPSRSRGRRLLAPARGQSETGVETFVLATHFGYARDRIRSASFATSPGCPDATWPRVGSPARRRPGGGRTDRTPPRACATPTARRGSQAQRGLWRVLAPSGSASGRPAAQAAASAFLELVPTGERPEVLPPHHFVQFEGAARSIRKAEAEGRVLVVPLGLATAGGFLFDVGRMRSTSASASRSRTCTSAPRSGSPSWPGA